MAYHVLVSAGHVNAGGVVAARQTFEKLLLLLLTERFWPHNPARTGHPGMQPGDRALFCMATRTSPEVVGEALVASASTPLTARQLAETGLYLGPTAPPEPGAFTHGVALERVCVWEEPWRPSGEDDPVAYDLARALAGAYHTGAVGSVGQQTFEWIMQHRRLTAPCTPVAAAPRSASEGAGAVQPGAEGAAQSFLLSNWDQIDFGEGLHILNGSGAVQYGQSPPGTFEVICEADDSGDLVAVLCVERPVPGDLAGAFGKHLDWLKQHAARPGQQVRGIIVAVGPHVEVKPVSRPDLDVRRLRLVCPSTSPAPAPRAPVPAVYWLESSSEGAAVAEQRAPAPTAAYPAAPAPIMAPPATSPQVPAPAPAPAPPPGPPAAPDARPSASPGAGHLLVPAAPAAAPSAAAEPDVPTPGHADTWGTAPWDSSPRPVTPPAAAPAAGGSDSPPYPQPAAFVAAPPQPAAPSFAEKCMSVPRAKPAGVPRTEDA